MVFVKVRETYDLHTVQNKMTVISIHTPKPDIIKKNYPGLLMQCKAYRPYSCNVKIACASVLPLDPRGIGLTEDDVAPEDIFNPILYKAMSNKGMSQLEARINQLDRASSGIDVPGVTANVEVDGVSSKVDEFNVYYGLLSNTRGWKHANPQSGLQMTDLKPLVYEMVYNIGDSGPNSYLLQGISDSDWMPGSPESNGNMQRMPVRGILGKAKSFPYLNCTSYSAAVSKKDGERAVTNTAAAGFLSGGAQNAEIDVPYLPVVVAGIIIPPSRLHQLFYRMVVEWTIEFTKIRSLVEITDFPEGLDYFGANTHYQNYSYSKVKEAVTGSDDSILESDSCMVSANVEVDKVM